MNTFPQQINEAPTVKDGEPDDVLILAASWEERCLGLVRRLGKSYACNRIALTVYDGKNKLREKHIEELASRLQLVGDVKKVDALHSNPLVNVREIVDLVNYTVGQRKPRISIDISTFTVRHLLQLLHGLDLAGMLSNAQFFHTEPDEYNLHDGEPIAHGISEVKSIETFSGRHHPSRDSLLVLFLGYESKRALALWEHMEPNITQVVIPDPPYRPEWIGRAKEENRYLLSCLPEDNVYKSHSLDPAETEDLLINLVESKRYNANIYNYRIAPVGTKAQTLGIYRFWRRHPGLATIMYATPLKYKNEEDTYPPGRTWLIDRSDNWSKSMISFEEK